jgi:type IV pilus assembly protein PilO
MISQLSKKEKTILFSGLFLILSVIGFSYFLFIYPLKNTVEQKETELKNQQQLLAVMESRDIQSTDQLVESSVQLQKQIPVKPMLEQFIIDLEMAETFSNSQITSISFSDEGVTGTEDPSVTQTTPPADGTDNAGNPEQSSSTPKPAGIKEIKLDLSIETESYFDLEEFIDTIENIDRIVSVKSISFSGPPEVTSIGGETGAKVAKTTFSLSVSIYYYPGLEDLEAELPEMETEAPANKRNPLSDFSDLPTEEDANNE